MYELLYLFIHLKTSEHHLWKKDKLYILDLNYFQSQWITLNDKLFSSEYYHNYIKTNTQLNSVLALFLWRLLTDHNDRSQFWWQVTIYTAQTKMGQDTNFRPSFLAESLKLIKRKENNIITLTLTLIKITLLT